MMRKEKITNKINPKGKGLEIGPLCWPILTKDEASIQYVDHTTTDNLRAIYSHEAGIRPDEIVPIDFALEGRTLHDTVSGKKFDYVLASHVIEHVPDMVSWLNDMASVLKTGGVLSLAIPDKRYTFDIDRDASKPADIVGAYLDGLKKPSSAMVFDHFSNYRTKIDCSQAWSGMLHLSEVISPHRYSLTEATEACLMNRDTVKYIDTHCYVFTPGSFFDALKILLQLSMIPFEIVDFHDTAVNEYEFFVSLRKISAKNMRQAIKTIPQISNPTYHEIEARMHDLEDQLISAQGQLHDILHSRSWALTKPLRKVNKLLGVNRNKQKQ